MNILFLLKTFDIGGVEIVTVCLANKFAMEGHNVSIFAFSDTDKPSVTSRLRSDVKVYIGSGLVCNRQNIESLHRVLVNENTQIVINQWGLPRFPIKTLKRASKGLDVKVISVYHNNPCMNGRLQGVDNLLAGTHNAVKIALLKCVRYAFKEITARSMRRNYYDSDRYIVLSDSFVSIFKSFTGIKDAKKLIVQTNPVSIETDGFELDYDKKDKEILFVGRLDNYQKKVNRVVETWGLLEAKHPDWQLTIVGDGPERQNVEQLAIGKGLQRVSFEGFQSPIGYYKRASMLILTSEFEGFPLVLAEAMSFGVVPTVYDSYPAVHDIIRNGENGMIVEPIDGKFSVESMANALSELMAYGDKRDTMAKAAIKTSNNYSIEKIYKDWNMKFNEVLRKNALVMELNSVNGGGNFSKSQIGCLMNKYKVA